MYHTMIRRAVIAAVAFAPLMAAAHGADRAQGEQFAKDLQAGRQECAAIADAQFENMGDYYMEQMMGQSHEQMDAMMEQMMGEEGLAQMHVAMGKRMSGCDASAPMPAAMMSGMGGMMNMVGGSGLMNAQNTGSTWGKMMRSAYPPGFVTLWYAVGVLGAIALVLAIVKYLRELFK